MGAKSKISILSLTCALAASALLFQNCGSGVDGEKADPLDLNSSNACGKAGFAFLHKNYFVPKCSGCHDGLVEPRFASPTNLDLSFLGANLIPATNFRKSVLESPFCGEDCRLDPNGDMYKRFNLWLSCRYE